MHSEVIGKVLVLHPLVARHAIPINPTANVVFFLKSVLNQYRIILYTPLVGIHGKIYVLLAVVQKLLGSPLSGLRCSIPEYIGAQSCQQLADI